MNKPWKSTNLKIEDITIELSDESKNQIQYKPLNQIDAYSSLNHETHSEFHSIQNQLEHGTGAIIIKNFPLAEQLNQVESNYLSFLSHFGHILHQNNIGDLVSNVMDVNVTIDDVINKGIKQDKTKHQTNNRPYQTNAHLEFHTDLCDVATLLCLQNARQGGDSRIVSSIAIYEEMQTHYPDELIELSNQFYINHQTPLKKDGLNHLIQIPVFSTESNYFSSFLLGTYVKMTYNGIGKKLAQKAIDGFDRIQEIAAREEFQLSFRLQPGDILMLNNHITYHSRDSYVDQEDDCKRHLLRAWVSTFNNRPLSQNFRELYGSNLAANTRRGGFEKLIETPELA